MSCANNSISQEKPSAIYRINSNAKAVSAATADMDDMMDDDAQPVVEEFDITVGIAIEPAAQAQAMIDQQRSAARSSAGSAQTPRPNTAAPQSADDIATLANKIVQHAYNFLGSFTTPDGKVPMKAFNDWWAKFKSRLASDPRFLDNL